jgi:U3 small nucleolar RNA-associated protein 19
MLGSLRPNPSFNEKPEPASSQPACGVPSTSPVASTSSSPILQKSCAPQTTRTVRVAITRVPRPSLEKGLSSRPLHCQLRRGAIMPKAKKASAGSSSDGTTNIASLVTKPMNLQQRKALLRRLQTPAIISSLRRPEILMDFFTDSLNMGDLSLSVPALTGLYHLIATRNLDYPQFYPRLYALLDHSLLHSKYRSRVMRHLETFLAPTNHLPAATIASFIKRLSRLCLFAPPAAIVAVVPFIYNLLKQHPSTTFMIHRKPHPPYTKSEDRLGEDAYDPAETDPQVSGAIDSSLWELETLQSHYHPTVASICRIISEQFTKQQYQVEDFLDNSYATMMDSELNKKEGKREREPVVEWQIPKRIFARDPGEVVEDGERNLVKDLWCFD